MSGDDASTRGDERRSRDGFEPAFSDGSGASERLEAETHDGLGEAPPLAAMLSTAQRRAMTAPVVCGDGGAVDRDLFGRPPKDHPDWSHRRGEPRVFALGWSIYLMTAVMMSFATAGVGRVVSADSYRPSARAMMLLLAVGVVVLWPMTRLSQARPSGGSARAVAKDLVVVLVPLQALVWPQVLLTRWPLEVVLLLSLTLVGWGLLTGAMLAAVLGSLPKGARRVEDPAEHRAGVRVLSMAAWLVLCLLGAAASLVMPGLAGITEEVESAVRMSSPFTAVFELTRYQPWTGATTAAASVHWWSVCVLGILVVVSWLGVWLAGRGLGRNNP